MKIEEVKNFHCPECHTEIGQYLPANTSIVQAVADVEGAKQKRMEMWISAIAAFVVTVLVGLFEPVHRFLHAHVEILAGVLAGTLLQSIGWFRDRWRWMKWFSHQ